jgi:hypothetical protein
MEQLHDLDPKLQRFADIAVAEIAVPPLRRRAPAAARTRAPRRPLVLVAALGLVLFASGAALATGLFSEVFRIGNVSAVGSRTVTLDGARVAQLPLPRSPQLQGGWNIKQVELTMTDAWRSVDLQYARAGSHGMGIGVWSDGISVNPTTEHIDTTTVDGVPVEIGNDGTQRTARFSQGKATVIIRVFAAEVGQEELESLVSAWLKETR